MIRAFLVVLLLPTSLQARAVPAMFKDLPSTAKAALADAIALTHESEFGGAIYRCSDVYAYTPPKTSGAGYSINVRVRVPEGCSLVAIYHTHPRGYLSARFSPEDLRVACALQLPSFIQTPDDDPRVLEPTAGACRDLARAAAGARDASVLRGRRFKRHELEQST